MKALKKLNLKNLVFIDIETARVEEELQEGTPMFDSWEYTKRNDKLTLDELKESYKKEAGLFAEFARVVCISVGRLKGDKLAIKTYNNENEKELLEDFNRDLGLVADSNPKTVFCGHAAIGFDIPFIFKRCMINQIEPDELLDTAHLKPWEVSTIDTKDLWKGTSFRPSSLINIAVALGIPSPKDDISGAEVGDLYWSKDKNRVNRISVYCEKDVLTTANVVRRCRFEPLLEVYDAKNTTKVVEEEEEVSTTLMGLFDGGKFEKAQKDALTEILNKMSSEEREKAYIVLDSLTSTAQGKKTKLTKAHVKLLKAKKWDN